jgi:GAF domain-containing protein
MAEPTPLSRYLAILPQTPEERILRLLVQLGMDITHADEGSLLVLDQPSRELVFAMTIGSRESDGTLTGQRIPLGKGITGLAAATGEVQIGAPTFKDIRQRETLGDGPSAVLAAPMLVDDTLIGVITAVSFQPDFRFGAREADLYAGFAAIAGLVVQQRWRLNLQGDSSERPDSNAPTEKERLERSILESIHRIFRMKPERLSEVARLLETVEKLAGSTLG